MYTPSQGCAHVTLCLTITKLRCAQHILRVCKRLKTPVFVHSGAQKHIEFQAALYCNLIVLIELNNNEY